MPIGAIKMFTIGYTAGDVSSARKNYPIKQKYKQIVDTQNPVFPSSYSLYNAQKYWMPYLGITSDDFNFIEYTDGDEYGWSDDNAVRVPEIPDSTPKTQKYKDLQENFRIVYNNEIYQSTDYMFDWGETGFDGNINPYKSTTIRKWKKISDTSVAWAQYWYHPLLRRFYLLENIQNLQELPDFDEVDQSKWSSFIGDAADMNLSNFTFSQIRQLVKTGLSQQAAVSVVESLDANVVSKNEQQQQQQEPPAAQIGQFTTTSTNPLSSGESSSSKQNMPAMVQRSAAGFSLSSSNYVYLFNLRPNNISYTNIGLVWTDIDRVNDAPLTDYKSDKLMKASFEFVVEAHSGNISSIYETCEEQLELLQQMAKRPEHIIFVNFDRLLSGTSKISLDSYRTWIIADLSINSVQLTPMSSDTAVVGQISRATVQITVQEVINRPDDIIFMPRLRKVPQTPSKKCTKNCGDTASCRSVATDSTPTGLAQPQIEESSCQKKFKAKSS